MLTQKVQKLKDSQKACLKLSITAIAVTAMMIALVGGQVSGQTHNLYQFAACAGVFLFGLGLGGASGIRLSLEKLQK